MYCPKCGKELPEDANFCPNCDAQVSGIKLPSTPDNSSKQLNEKKQEPVQKPERSILFWILIFIGAIGIVIIISAISAALLFGMAGTETPNSDSPVVSATISPSWHILLDETKQISFDSYQSYYDSSAKQNDIYSLEINTDGAAIDLFVIDAVNNNKYILKEDFDSIFERSNIIRGTYSFTIPKTDTYYIILDNRVIPLGGAYSGRAVNTAIKISKYY
jgi:hypothetical protein